MLARVPGVRRAGPFRAELAADAGWLNAPLRSGPVPPRLRRTLPRRRRVGAVPRVPAEALRVGA